MAIVSELELWIDPHARSGAENMAVDEILHRSVELYPLLRIYRWSRDTVSFGYFEKLSDAKHAFPASSIDYVRRWTGGGIVDHRNDLTYTLSIPKGHPLEQQRGNASYAYIHQALAKSMQAIGVACDLITEDVLSDSRSCFVKPVAFDIVDQEGRKLAGAGQKRSRCGLLHQGSVQGVLDREAWLEQFVRHLATHTKEKDISENALVDVSALVRSRYGSLAWTQRRP